MTERSDKQESPILRPAANADAGRIARLVFDVLAEYSLQPDPDGTDADLRDIEQSYLQNGGTFFVLELSDRTIIGSYGLYRIDHQTCELRKMYVHKDYRGRRLGKRLMNHALTRARELGFKTMTLETAAILKEAIALYKANGFKEYTPKHLVPRADQAYIRQL